MRSIAMSYAFDKISSSRRAHRSPDVLRRLDALDRAGRRTAFNVVPPKPRKAQGAWTMAQVARSAAHSLRKTLRRVGMTAAEAASDGDVLLDIYNADARATAGTARFPRAYRWTAATHRIGKIADKERKHHRGRDEQFFDRCGLDRNGRRRVRGIWRSAALATQDAQTGTSDPAAVCEVQEVIDMLPGIERELFRLHVIEGYSLGKTALRLGVRKATVVAAWRALRAHLRTTLVESAKKTC